MIRSIALASFSSLAVLVYGQKAGIQTAEVHPPLAWKKCVTGGSCTIVSGSVTLDADWRKLYNPASGIECFTGNTWNPLFCGPPISCAQNCALDGADYSGTYGVTTSGNAINLKFTTNSAIGTNIGSRVYLMASDTAYEKFKLKNKEFTFDVDVSNLGCGLNGALYFIQMDADGGKQKYPNNQAGAKYGTGYCDSKCSHSVKFINGEANVYDWTPISATIGAGRYGSCCAEMNIWDANSISAAFTAHSCSVQSPVRCQDSDCGVCDRDGCDFNSYRLGDTSFYGQGLTIDTTSKITVVTQFFTGDGTDHGDISQIRRLYVQNGIVIQNSQVNIPGISAYDSITDEFCDAQKTVFGAPNAFAENGGLTSLSQAFENGMVLAMGVWDDYESNMLWLDGDYPYGTSPYVPGVSRGTCPASLDVLDVEAQQANASVKFSNIKFGPIGSTY